jgi:hypothetical protein
VLWCARSWRNSRRGLSLTVPLELKYFCTEYLNFVSSTLKIPSSRYKSVHLEKGFHFNLDMDLKIVYLPLRFGPRGRSTPGSNPASRANSMNRIQGIRQLQVIKEVKHSKKKMFNFFMRRSAIFKILLLSDLTLGAIFSTLALLTSIWLLFKLVNSCLLKRGLLWKSVDRRKLIFYRCLF